MRAMFDILTDEKLIIEERDMIYELVLRADSPEEDDFLRDKLNEKNTQLEKVRTELREYLSQLNK